MNKPKEHRMCPFCLNKQTGDETTIFSSALTPQFIQIRTELFEAIFELADRNTYSYESIQDLLFKLLSDRTLSASPRISKHIAILLSH